MGKYRKRLSLADAFQMSRERLASNSEWPEWLNQAWNYDRDEPGALYRAIPGKDDGPLMLRNSEGHCLVGCYAWVVRDEKGELHSYSPNDFYATYEPVEE